MTTETAEIGKIKENLERYHRSAIEISEKITNDPKKIRGFFLMVGDYVNYFDKTKPLYEIAKDVVDIRTKKATALEASEIKVAAEIKKTADVLLKEARKAQAPANTLHRVGNIVNEINQYIDGKIKSSASLCSNTQVALQDIVKILYDDGLQEFVKPYIKEVGKPIFPELNDDAVAPSLKEHRIIEEEFKEEDAVSIWNALNNLLLAHEAFFQGQKKWNELRKNNQDGGKTWELFNYSGILGEKNKIMEKKDDTKDIVIIFKKDSYVIDLARVHNYLMRELSSDSDSGGKMKYSPSAKTLSIGSKTVHRFNEDSEYAKLFSKLFIRRETTNKKSKRVANEAEPQRIDVLAVDIGVASSAADYNNPAIKEKMRQAINSIAKLINKEKTNPLPLELIEDEQDGVKVIWLREYTD